jgi:hypothetical protein
MATVAQKLRDLCVGHPAAEVPWPHRTLHEAADALDEALAALRLVKDAVPVDPLHAYSRLTIPHSAFLACGAARSRLEADQLQPGDIITVPR